MIDTREMASQLSLPQIDALSKLVKRMAATLAWPQNHKNPANTGFDQQDLNKLSLLLQHPEYATTDKLEEILIPIQDRFLQKIANSGQKNQETNRALNDLVGNIRPLFDTVSLDIPEATKLMQSCIKTHEKAEEIGYLVSLIATIINPPTAQVYYPEFGRK